MTTPTPTADPAAQSVADGTQPAAAGDDTGQPDTQAHTDADADAPDAAEPDTDEHDDQGDDDRDDDDDKSKAARDAARYRRQLRETQDELTATQALVHIQRDAIISAAVQRAGIDPRLLDAAGIDQGDMLDDRGCVDFARVNDAIAKAVAELGVQPRQRPRPVPGQGRPGGGTGEPKWSDVLGSATRK